MLKMPRMMAVLGAMLAALLITGAALAQQTPPHTFYGFGGVTIDGEPAPAGTTITAMAGGENVGMGTVGANDAWDVEVPGGTMGVTFMINDMAATAGQASYDAPQGENTQVPSLAATSSDAGSGDELDEGDGDGDSSGGDSMSEGDSSGGDSMSEGSDSLQGEDGSDSMDEGGSMQTEGEGAAPDTVLPDTGTGGLADSSRGVSSAVYGGIAGALALIALAGGVAIRRRAQS